MHPYALIPIAAILVSAAFGAVSVVWNSGRHPTPLMTALFLCTGTWAALDLLTFLGGTPEVAEFALRAMPFPVLLMGPSVTWLMAQLFPELRSRLVRAALFGSALAVLAALALVISPNSVVSVVPTDWGSWVPRYGWLSIVAMPCAALLPMLAVSETGRLSRNREIDRTDRSRVRAVRIVVGFSMLAAISTEYVMPLLEIAVPRLGALSIASVSAVMWIRVRHVADALAVTPDALAQSILDELHDGVVRVHVDGTIVAASRRFAQMIDRGEAELAGVPFGECVDTPIEEILGGLDDQKSFLRRSNGTALPVSLSSSVIQEAAGMGAGAVVVIRDLREIDALRRRLLTSGRLAAIGELAAGIAHEVNNPIAFVRSDLHLLAHRLTDLQSRLSASVASGSREERCSADEFERVGGRVQTAIDRVDRVAQVVGDVRSFAHVGGVGQGGSDPAVLVEGALRLARLQRGDEVVLRAVESVDHEWIECGQEVKQVLLALILVLVEGSEKGGVVEAGITSDAGSLRVELVATQLGDRIEDVVDRFERLSGGDLDDTSVEFGPSIIAELMSQLDASISLTRRGPASLAVEFQLSGCGRSVS